MTSAVAKTSSLVYYTNQFFGEYLKDDSINEIAYQKPHEIWVELNTGEWVKRENELDETKALSLAITLAGNIKADISDKKPILSCVLPEGERVQVVIPPASNLTSVTIRKPSRKRITFNDLRKSNIFNEIVKLDPNYISETDKELVALYNSLKWEQFLAKAVEYGKTIIIAGETGSGKTTFMKSLIDFIPKDERIITIEDVPEIKFYEHENYINLFYPSEAKPSDFLNSATLLKSCLRMKPDRILLAELRGGETYDFLNVISSGHKGSITSLHAGSPQEAFIRLAFMILQNEQGQCIPFDRIIKMLTNVIHIVVHFTLIKGKRVITGVYFDLVNKDISESLLKG
ncbi:MAG: P-type DNA transfer ATPase VirB11 [Campylobacteraceae bacterium]|jgi:type IV secretion system protein VirB11|nr:P-type DNA transfer ATPase VirB11 [Campylobacteraceae bacterium]